MQSSSSHTIDPQSMPLRSSGGGLASSIYYRVTFFFRRISSLVDSLNPYPAPRWAFSLILLGLFVLRIVLSQGWYVVAYALGIYLLSAFLAFLTPKFEPSLDDMDNEANLSDPGPALPTKADEEFRPFIRRLPEFVFWCSATQAIFISFACTLFDFLDIPVFWPILLIYFIVLVVLTMKRQIKHMIKYKYVPFDIGKKSYSGKGLR